MGGGRIAELDIIKGICIIGIVFSHAGHELMWLSYIFLFGFYFVGGATYKDRPLKIFFFSKVKRIYVPFVIANLFGEFISYFMRIFTKYGGGDVIYWDKYLISILKFDLKEAVMTPCWYLLPLFCISFIFFFLKRILKKNKQLFLVTFCFFVIATHYRTKLSKIVWNNCAIIINVAIGLFIYTCGYVYKNVDRKKYIENNKYALDICLLSFFILCEAKYYWNYHLDLRAGIISSGKWMLITYVAGTIFLLYFSGIVAKYSLYIKSILIYIGRRSMSIMFFHAMCFSLITLIGIYVIHDSYNVSWTNAIYGKWYYEYANACVGLTVPLIGDYILDNLKKFWSKQVLRK